MIQVSLWSKLWIGEIGSKTCSPTNICFCKVDGPKTLLLATAVADAALILLPLTIHWALTTAVAADAALRRPWHALLWGLRLSARYLKIAHQRINAMRVHFASLITFFFPPVLRRKAISKCVAAGSMSLNTKGSLPVKYKCAGHASAIYGD